jgi:hypothetical protein
MKAITYSVMNKRRNGELIKKKRTQRVVAACLTAAVVFFTYGVAPVFAAGGGISIIGSKLEEVVVEQAAVLSVDEDSQVEKLVVEEIAKDSEIKNDGTIYVAEIPSGSRPIYGTAPILIVAAPTPNDVTAAPGVTDVAAETAPGSAESGVNTGRKSVTVSDFDVSSTTGFARVEGGNQIFITAADYNSNYDAAFKGIKANLAITGYADSVAHNVTVGFSLNGASPVNVQSGTITTVTALNGKIPLSTLIDAAGSDVNIGEVLGVLAKTTRTGTVGISLTVDGDYYPDLFKVVLVDELSAE